MVVGRLVAFWVVRVFQSKSNEKGFCTVSMILVCSVSIALTARTNAVFEVGSWNSASQFLAQGTPCYLRECPCQLPVEEVSKILVPDPCAKRNESLRSA